MSSEVQKIRQEIERLKMESLEGKKDYYDYYDGVGDAYDEILQFIDSLSEEPTIKGITWEDVNTLESLIYQVHNEYPSIGEKSFGLEVLERFQECQDDVEEPETEDLEEEINKVDDWYPVELKYIQAIAHHFVEWQKQKDEQDFIKKACEYLKREYEDIGVRYIRGIDVNDEIELFKEYMKNKK